MSKPRELQHDLERSLPAIASISTSLSHSQGLSPYCYFSPEKRKAISDVRRTFCLFVTFDLLFISLLWIIELNVSRAKRTPGAFPLLSLSAFVKPVPPASVRSLSQVPGAKSLFALPGARLRFLRPGSVVAARGR